MVEQNSSGRQQPADIMILFDTFKQVQNAHHADELLQGVVENLRVLTGSRIAAAGDYAEPETFLCSRADNTDCLAAFVPDNALAAAGKKVLSGKTKEVGAMLFAPEDLETEKTTANKGRTAQSFSSLLVAPVQNSSGVSAGLILICCKTEGSFSQDDVAMAGSFAEMAGNGLELLAARNSALVSATEVKELIDAMPAAVWIAADPECRKISGNKMARKLMRQPQDQDIHDFTIKPDTFDFDIYEAGELLRPENLPMQTAAATGKPVHDRELLFVFKDRISRHVRGNAIPLFDPMGKVRGCIGAFWDVTSHREKEEQLEQYRLMLEKEVEKLTGEVRVIVQDLRDEIEEHRLTEEALRQSENMYSTLVEDSLTGIFLLQKGRFVFMNRRFADMYGYTRDELYAVRPAELLHPDDKDLVDEMFVKHRNGSGIPEEMELQSRKKDGSVIWVQGRSSIVEYKERRALLVNVIDITEKKEAESALRQASEALRHLASQLLRIQEQERKQVANDIHDTVCQLLAGIKFRLENAMYGFKSGKDAEALVRKLETSVTLVQESIDICYRIQGNLWPPTLDDLGLGVTIESFCRKFAETFNQMAIHQHIEIDDADIPDHLKIVIFRVMQEAMYNAAKHSGARSLWVSLKKESGGMVLEVRDSGSGFDLDKNRDPGTGRRGVGLGNMRERVGLTEGSFNIVSKKGRGTTVTARWEIDKQEQGKG